MKLEKLLKRIAIKNGQDFSDIKEKVKIMKKVIKELKDETNI